MTLTSTSAFGRWQKAAWPVARLFLRPRTRWFVEGHPKLDGQLWLADRRLLDDTVRAFRPAACFEIGTWKGGGSTLFIAQALCDNGAGVLHTIEVDAAMAAEAGRNYADYLPHLLPHVRFHVGDYREEFGAIMCPGPKPGTYRSGAVDLLFLDGAEDARETLAQYEFFLPFMHRGSVLLAHDWLTDKARLIKDRLEDPAEWRIDTVLLPPRSVGMVRAVRV